ncbi:mannose-1-phosphate guanylyltransferase/mannose-6-phosphate isomerase [Prochlorococcus marinus XMU1406]|uniref:mannose-1-phosphate guanylyltransferase/mannose-6-phosphate isomerase n=1 Tax=Prochlorococcus marinus TaxID=1219 RepID=UPI001ADA11AB|nr:mannose-1-phosphate guanylyltransferase/mannose-6-phosphate isomerase [Prochlorococcus marinus]MBO8206801.1 mannose-1-phosphate guanylyltransferase/mannose-6-phosphate isomerase [Prochlorococcus marinus XMU1406]MCR8542620.1 mannose-1-phosphate guanylyltransferase/mannose-6-phosphate isomerase [Prochlorococcus marinus XMU1427]
MTSKTIYKIVPIILAGGTGSRLWPLSRKSFPKQFLNLLNDDRYTMLQKTYKRIDNLEHICRPIVICNEEHRFIVGHQMKEINIEPLEILLEPVGRNTTPAITIAALKALDIFKETNIEPILLILSSDHQIKDINNFQLAIKNSIENALNDNLIIFGVPPTYPSTGYGYIRSANQLDPNQYFASKVDKFIEKPNKKNAKSFIEDKKYTWNSGMFVFKATSILNEIKRFAPEIIKNCEKCLKKSKRDFDFLRLEEEAFRNCDNISIDISVFEKTNKAFVIPLNCGWDDVGSWESLWKMSKKDQNGNYLIGRVLAKETKESLIRSEEKLVVSIGLENIVIVETKDAILVANKESSQNVKNIVSLMNEKGFNEAINHKIVYRPWGSFLSIEEGKTWQIKKIEVNPGASLSLQMHFHRSEHWVVVNGTAKILIEDNEKIIGPNESAYIPLGVKHRLSNPTKFKLTLIEIQSGSYLGEDDIKRFEDKYGR